MNINAMILGMCCGGMVTLACLCSSLRYRIEKLEKDVEKLIENSQN